MKIIVKAKTRAREEKVERISQSTFDFDNAKQEMVAYKVSVKEPPVNGKANAAIVKALAKYFEITQSQIRLISGKTSKQKIFEIL